MSDRPHVLVTGGAGYVGSHACVELLAAGYDLTVVDNLENGSREALRRVEELAGRPLEFARIDVRDRDGLASVLARRRCEAVLHFAGLKAIGESWDQPVRYFDTNVGGTMALLAAMDAAGCRRIVFSSSATVYGQASAVPIAEDARLSTTSPYGTTKLVVEQLLGELACRDPRWEATVLRYFNPVGAHGSGRLGEDPRGPVSNLMPAVARVAIGRAPELRIFGDDYETADGTGVRDYVHVVDVAAGHVAALARPTSGCRIYNLGTGRGHSVREVVGAFERASGRPIPCRVVPRRPGDVAVCYADPTRARCDLGWTATRDLDAMCADAWRFQHLHPDGLAAASAP